MLVDNETAMKNVMKMAKSSGASAESEKISDREYKVMITVEEKNAAVSESDQKGQTAGKESRAQAEGGGKKQANRITIRQQKMEVTVVRRG
ncbi:hypothetical protein M5E84_08845 [[Ruminococcus] torques]|nr:hypothetical protein M5E84_08845 [[Ruminococcus] torques]